MTDQGKGNGFWPDVSTVTGARSAVMYGVWAAVFSAIVTALFAAWALGSGKSAEGFINAWAFIDAVIFAVVAFGIYKESRFAAVAGLVIFFAEKIFQVVETRQFQGAWLAVVMVICYVAAIRGTYALARLRKLPVAG